MICTLKENHLTDEWDLVPAGTPVDVLGWGEDSPAGWRQVLCRAHAYMYVGERPDDLSGWDGNVGSGLYIEVHPSILAFQNSSGKE